MGSFGLCMLLGLSRKVNLGGMIEDHSDKLNRFLNFMSDLKLGETTGHHPGDRENDQIY